MRNGKMHYGQDYPQGTGTPIRAVASGTVVVSSEDHFGWGVAIQIDHGDGFRSLYGHMNYGTRKFSVGQWVNRGDHIGDVGNTGHSFGSHLHLEISINGTAVNPIPYVQNAPLAGSGPVQTGVYAAPAAIIDSADRISLYAVRSDGNLWGASQSNAGGSFNAWQLLSSTGASLVGRPSALLLSSGVIAVYARTSSGTIVGTNQLAPGGAFTPWTTIGTNGAGIVSDPVVVQISSGAIGVYAMTDAGYVAGTSQGGPGGAFSSWVAIGSTSTTLMGRPALVRRPDDRLVLFATSVDGFVHKSEQPVAGGSFTNWGAVGTGGAQINSEPVATIDQDRISVFAAAGSTVSSVTQDGPGGPFNSWVNLGAGPTSLAGATPFVIAAGGYHSIYTIGADRLIWGTSVVSPPTAAAAWSQIGTGTLLSTVPVGVRTSSGLNCIYAASNGTVVGTNQSSAGGYFGNWATI